MSELRVDSVKSKGGGAPDLPKGVNISGIATASTLGATTVDVSNVNVSGVVTSGTLSGSLLSTGTPTLGLGVTINSSGVVISGVATAGIVSATTLYGDGTNLTGVGVSIAPLFYNPDLSDSSVTLGTGIGITFNQQIKAGTGNITIRETNASGTVVENFGVGSSVTISENTVSFDPTADLSVLQTYHISYPSGCFTNNEGTDYVGTAYTFKGQDYSSRTLWRWGLNEYGELGLNAQGVEQSSPTQVPGTTWRSLAISMTKNIHNTATKTDGTLWAWGTNAHGQLGQNSRTEYSSPVQVGSGTDWSKSHAQVYKSSMAVKTDGTLWSCGYNTLGRLGDNTLINRSSPVQIPGTTWSSTAGTLAGGAASNAAAIKTDGTLWVWGGNEFGNLAQNNVGPSNSGISSPVQVPGTTWSKVTSGGNSVYAIKTDGTLWGWGLNDRGQLGQNSVTGAANAGISSPVQIPGTTWGKISSSAYAAAAIKTDGTMWVFGKNDAGQLGQNSQVEYSSPVQIPGTTWAASTGTLTTFLATKTDGTLWSWGSNGNGALGQNAGAPAKISSPTQIPGTDWGTEIYHIGANWDGFGAIQTTA